ncbi:hypothetical protein [Massilibacteroides sp.]|uniref:hypothetical protein n=1 Tax=Massilibacteroides sp. TaxID=2034766 RepID=UPI0026122B7E|nr:hypothetical protein [Massilibacteroides sp.]MDD4515213.1 hypothetical protein [Massilibacteroides sp.]
MIKKAKQLLPILLLGGTLLIGTSSSGDERWEGDYVPVFMKRTELEKSVFFNEESRDLKNPGKIYTKDHYIFINEKYKGIHVIDNTTPASPKQIGFIVAPGCIDMAIKGSTLYLDNAVDLVAFNLETRTVTERIPFVFPEPLSPQNYSYYGDRKDDLILVGWNKREIR